MEYTNPLLGLTSSQIASAPDPATSVELSVPTPVESSEPSVPMPAESSIPAPAPLDSIESQYQGKTSNSITPLQPGTGGVSTAFDSAQALGKLPTMGKGGAKKAQKMRPSKTSTAR